MIEKSDTHDNTEALLDTWQAVVLLQIEMLQKLSTKNDREEMIWMTSF